MATLTLPWETGEGKLIINFNGNGTEAVTVESDTPNEGIDRSLDISFKSIGISPEIVVNRTVKQIGLREPYNVLEGHYLLADGSTYNVLKS